MILKLKLLNTLSSCIFFFKPLPKITSSVSPPPYSGSWKADSHYIAVSLHFFITVFKFELTPGLRMPSMSSGIIAASRSPRSLQSLRLMLCHLSSHFLLENRSYREVNGYIPQSLLGRNTTIFSSYLVFTSSRTPVSPLMLCFC